PTGETTRLRHRNPSALRTPSVSGTRPSLSVAPCISDLVTNCNLCRKKPCDQGFYPSEVQPSGSSRDHSIICSRCFRHRPALDVTVTAPPGREPPDARDIPPHGCTALLLNAVTEPRTGQAGGSSSEHIKVYTLGFSSESRDACAPSRRDWVPGCASHACWWLDRQHRAPQRSGHRRDDTSATTPSPHRIPNPRSRRRSRRAADARGYR